MIRINQIDENKISEVFALTQQMPEFREIKSIDFLLKRLQGEISPIILIANYDGKPAGFLVAYDRDHDNSIYCWLAGVKEEFQRNGILTSLMNELIKKAKEKGHNKLKIRTRNNRRKMLAYLVKEGFNFVEIEPHDTAIENRIALEKEI